MSKRLLPAALMAVLMPVLLPACGDDGPAGPVDDGGNTGPTFTWQNPFPHANHYVSVLPLSGGRVAAFTFYDALVTGDGGDTWEVLEIEGPFYAANRRGDVVCVLTQTRAYVSADGGDTWRPTAPHGISANVIAFFDNEHGVVGGSNGAVVTTADGGATWTRRFSDTNEYMRAVDYLSATVLFAGATNATLIRSTNRGEVWSELNNNSEWGTPLAMDHTGGVVRFTDSASRILTSTNNGVTWSTYQDAIDFYAIDFLDATRGVVAGREGTVRITSDGGITWVDRSVPGSDEGFETACRPSADQIWAAGFNGAIYRSDNIGVAWNSIRRGRLMNLRDVSFSGEQSGIAVGEREVVSGSSLPKCGVLTTSDGGRTWTRGILGDPGNLCLGGDLNAVWMLDPMRAVAVGDGGEVWTTADGGASWTFRDANVTEDLNDVVFVGDTGIIVGDDGRKRHSTDGGITWSAGITGTGTTNDIRGVAYGSSTVLVLVGDDGAIRRSTNGGQFWGDFSANIPDNYYRDVAILDENAIVVIGSGSPHIPVYRTTDGGDSWTTTELFGGQPPGGAMSFADDRHGIIVSLHGDVHLTDDGGATWEQQPRFTSQGIQGACAIGSNFATLVGSRGTIVRIER